MFYSRRSVAVGSLLLSGMPAFAQVGGVWPGTYGSPPVPGSPVIYGTVWPGPFYGYYPPYYRQGGSWNNGYSLYGPPVPTYGSVPGTFGAADYRLNNGGPGMIYPGGAGVGIGVRYPVGGGTAGVPVGTAMPPMQGRPATMPSPPPVVPPQTVTPAVPASVDTATVDVRLPPEAASAELYVEDVRVNATGTRRLLTTKPMKPGSQGNLSIKAIWSRDGKQITQFRTVAVQPGSVAVADFTRFDTSGPALPAAP